ncbi:hypothetical protein MMC26_001399 [Xylographa opegraphella]|nr:hypothetical protein [Xylographa opegraphella]
MAVAVATVAYLSALTQFPNDYSLLKSLVKGRARTAAAEKSDRLNLFYILEAHAHAKSTANHPFLIYEGTTWTYKEVYDIVLKYGTWLKTNYSIAPCEVVSLDFMNSPKFIFIWFALWSLGAYPALINYNLTSKPLLHCIRSAGARILFVDDEVQYLYTSEVLGALGSAEFRDGKGPVEVVFLDPDLERAILNMEGVREPNSSRAGVKSTSKAMLLYTSGTTGLPKATVVPWFRIYNGASFTENWMGWSRSDRFYTVSTTSNSSSMSITYDGLQPMPLYHGTANLLGLLSCLAIGSTIIIGHKFGSKTFWPEVRESKATIIQYVGETCRYLMAAPPLLDPITRENLDSQNDVRMAFGNGLRPDIWNRFKERFGIETIAEFYASTEGVGAGWNLSSNSFSTGATGKGGTMAKLFSRSRHAIVELDWETESPARDPKRNNYCTRVQPGAPGELLYWVDPKNIQQNYNGYYQNEKASNDKVLKDVFSKGDMWFRTGDVIRIDTEGRMYFCDRIGDTFRWKAQNVSTSEVAELLGTHPAIIDHNIYGVELPAHDGRAGCAATVLNREVDSQLLASIAAHVHQQLPIYAVPVFLRVTKEIQATGNNKQQKHILRNQGVHPGKVDPGDKLYWLRGGTYVEFHPKDWEAIEAGQVKL